MVPQFGVTSGGHRGNLEAGKTRGIMPAEDRNLAEDGILQPGTVALVTGASAGIGAATARVLAARGARVICASRDKARLDNLVTELGAGAQAIQLDVADPASAESLIERLPKGLRAVDILVANAGHDLGGRRPFGEGAVADWANIIETNVIGMIRTCHAVVPGMVARGRGHVVTLGSTAGLVTYAGGTIYNASKFAVRGFTEALRKDYGTSDLRVTEILPGLTRTEFAASRHRGDSTKGTAYYDSFAEVLDPADIARAIVYALDQPARVTVAQMVVVPSHEK
jgi:3-hydroxy acid dehydrogenase/malonic semialdehyde reductase